MHTLLSQLESFRHTCGSAHWQVQGPPGVLSPLHSVFGELVMGSMYGPQLLLSTAQRKASNGGWSGWTVHWPVQVIHFYTLHGLNVYSSYSVVSVDSGAAATRHGKARRRTSTSSRLSRSTRTRRLATSHGGWGTSRTSTRRFSTSPSLAVAFSRRKVSLLTGGILLQLAMSVRKGMAYCTHTHSISHGR